MDSIASKIEERIRSWERGRIFFINDFADLGSAEVVRQTLNRLTKAEVILRPGRGVYCYPKEYGKEMEILGLSEKYIEPTVDDIAWAIAERDHSRIAPNIAYAQYQLGLSQQIPMNVVYLTDGSGRRIPMGQRHGILFKHTSDMSLFAYRNRLMQMIVISLKDIGEQWVGDKERQVIARNLKDVDRVDFDHDIKLAPEWMRIELQKLYEIH